MERTISKGRLLVVDDDRAVSGFLTDLLSEQGYECQNCPDGETALDTMRQQSFDVVILDLMMPGITGLEILALSRKQYPETAFLVLTGMDDVDVAAGAMKQGADDYLTKPCEPEAVVASVELAMKKKRAGRSQVR
ncbi:MAG: response regulator [Terriglobia bacterium]